MQSNYKRLGDYIVPIKVKNSSLKAKELLGINIDKFFMPSVANVVGTDLSKYKVVEEGQFACNRMHVGRDYRIPIALSNRTEPFIVSPAYDVFEIENPSILKPEYLMMWFSRKEFDRNAWFYTDADVRGGLAWDAFCNMEFPLPSPEEQNLIVEEYSTIKKRIELNTRLINKLEETTQAIYKQWFVDFEFPDENGNPYKSSGGKMVWCEEWEMDIPMEWVVGTFSDIASIIMGQSPRGDSYNSNNHGVPLVNGPVEFGDYFAVKSKWTTSPTKLSKIGDLIVCVRGSTIGRYVKCDDNYCLGRGVCVFRAKRFQCFTDLTYKNNYNALLAYTTGSTFPNWDRQTLSDYKIVIPLETCIERFENLIKPLFKYIENKSRENIALNDISNKLLSKLSSYRN